jgi:hypothetical protein
MNYCHKVKTNLVEIPGNERDFAKMLYWCHEHNSKVKWFKWFYRPSRYHYDVGFNQITIDPHTFQPVAPGPHKFYFEKEEDAIWFALKWR